MNKKDLFKQIAAESFALDEVILYLDTHPNCQKALSYYKTHKEKRDRLVKEYTESYGPITAYNVKTDNKWTWIEHPWPWEMED